MNKEPQLLEKQADLKRHIKEVADEGKSAIAGLADYLQRLQESRTRIHETEEEAVTRRLS